MKFTYRAYAVHVHEQSHRDYPPWGALVTRVVGGRITGFNVEGRTADEAAERAKFRIDEMGR